MILSSAHFTIVELSISVETTPCGNSSVFVTVMNNKPSDVDLTGQEATESLCFISMLIRDAGIRKKFAYLQNPNMFIELYDYAIHSQQV